MYLGQFELREQVAYIYPYIPDYLVLKDTLLVVIDNLRLVDYDKITEWFHMDSAELHHFALSVLKNY